MLLKNFTLGMGLAFLVIGILGFVPAFITPAHFSDPTLMVNSFHGRLFGLFPVNTVHNLVHMAFGIWGLLAAREVLYSQVFCRANSAIYAALALLGLLPALNTVFGIVPLHSHDIWLHASIAVLTGYFGFVVDPHQVTLFRKRVAHA